MWRLLLPLLLLVAPRALADSNFNEAQAAGFLAPTQVEGDNEVLTVVHHKVRHAHMHSHHETKQVIQEHHKDVLALEKGSENLLIRPNMAENKTDADVVKFSLVPKTFYGVNTRNNDFIVDLVMTLQWNDKRIAEAIPEGLESITMADSVAAKKIWMPGIDVTNRDVRKIELISSAVNLQANGTVTKVERSVAQIKCKYNLAEYPFDTQHLVTKIASTKLMLDELKMEPFSKEIKVPDNLLKGEPYLPVKFENGEFEDVNGLLKKSRGTMTMVIERDLTKYFQSFLLPSVLFMCISWGVFWLPFTQSFVNPRVGLSILSLLTFTNLSLKEGASLPPGAPFNWNELLVQNVQAMMFSIIFLNIFADICHFSLECNDTAKKVNHEVKLIYPSVTIVVVSIVMERYVFDLHMSSVISQTIVALYFVGYIGYSVLRCWREYQVKFGGDKAPGA